MSDKLTITSQLRIGIGLEITEAIFLLDAFVESQPTAGYTVHAGDSLNSWHDGTPKVSFSYNLMVTETIQYWAALLQELLQGGSLIISLDPEDTMNNWHDFVPNFTMAYRVAVHETLLLEDFVTMSQILNVIVENETDAFVLIDLLDLGYGLEL